MELKYFTCKRCGFPFRINRESVLYPGVCKDCMRKAKHDYKENNPKTKNKRGGIFNVIIPDTSDIKIGDVLKINGIKHVLTDEIHMCYECSVNHYCRKAASDNFCGVSKSAFKIINK